MRMLVAIANHGTKNQHHLRTVLDGYRAMEHEVDIVVLSDEPKDLGPDVEVRVGAPTTDPRSLPFAHRPLFVERADDYDLFLYSEDDTLVTQRHVDAFVEVNDLLPDHEVPGFQRYEQTPDGSRYYSSIHSTYRWDPTSVLRKGGETFADHTNLHSALYLVTRTQLQHAIESGGFDVPPHRGPSWSLMVTAVSDIYLQCGLRRRLCVSRMDDFLVHHLPDVYIGKLGVGETEYRTQLQAVEDVARGRRSAEQLFDPTANLGTQLYNPPQHPLPGPSPEVLALPTGTVRRPLSIGTTSGAVEVAMFPQAVSIVGVPVDEITATVARTRGIEVLAPCLESVEQAVPEGGFDAILFHHTLHHFAEPAGVLRALRPFAAPDVELLVTMPNTPYHRLRKLARRNFAGPVPRRGYSVDGIHAPATAMLRRVGRDSGVRWRLAPGSATAPRVSGRWLAARWTSREIHARGIYE
jgi:SAM-dependent methyltransferase